MSHRDRGPLHWYASAVVMSLLAAASAWCQDGPTLAGPAATSETVAERGLIAFVDGRWIPVETDAVKSHQGKHMEHEKGRKHEEYGLIVTQKFEQFGEAIPMPHVEGKPLEWVIIVPDKGTWQVIVFDTKKPTTPRVNLLVIGKPPEPNPPDPPDDGDDPVPGDQWDNIDGKVLQWSKGLPKRTEVGGLYKSAAGKLDGGEILSIDRAQQWFRDERDKLLTPAELSKWGPFGEKYAAESARLRPDRAGRQAFVDYYRTVAAGLGVK